jgi:ribonuclease HI
MAAFYVLNTDASIGTSTAAIGVVLRQKLRQGKPLTVVAYISKRIPKCDIATAEYRALIEGLRLAVPYEPTRGAESGTGRVSSRPDTSAIGPGHL